MAQQSGPQAPQVVYSVLNTRFVGRAQYGGALASPSGWGGRGMLPPPRPVFFCSATMNGPWGRGGGTSNGSAVPTYENQQQQGAAGDVTAKAALPTSSTTLAAGQQPPTAMALGDTPPNKPPPLAWALPPIPGGSSSGQQQQHQQQSKPFWLGPFAGSSTSAAVTGTGHSDHHFHHHHGAGGGGGGLHVEAFKLLGIVGAQLLIHFANLQRGVAQHGEELRGRPPPWHGLRFPWQRGGDGAAAPGASDGTSHAHARSSASEAAQRWIAQGIEAERTMQLREALNCYQSAVALEPTNLEYLCRVAKQWSDLTYDEGATTADVVEANSKAIEYAERAITLAPKWSGGYVASCVSRGRLALVSDNRTKVRLAKEAQEAARIALALDPQNDLAHHLMGRWHFEMAQINFVVRQLIKLIYGASLAPGTYTEALDAFQAAVNLAPGKLIHRVELGRTYLRLGRKREALEHLEASLDMDIDDVNAALERDEAEIMLTRLRREFDRGVMPLAWGHGSSGEQHAGATAAPAQQQQQEKSPPPQPPS